MKVRHLAALSLGLVLVMPAFAQDKPAAAPPEMSAEQKAMMEAWQKASTPNEKHKQLIAEFEGPLTVTEQGEQQSLIFGWSKAQSSVFGLPVSPQRISQVAPGPQLTEHCARHCR